MYDGTLHYFNCDDLFLILFLIEIGIIFVHRNICYSSIIDRDQCTTTIFHLFSIITLLSPPLANIILTYDDRLYIYVHLQASAIGVIGDRNCIGSIIDSRIFIKKKVRVA